MALKTFRFTVIVALCAAVLLLATLASSAVRAEGASGPNEVALPTLAPIVKRVMPSIVAVTSIGPAPKNPGPIDPRDGFPDPPKSQQIRGSGVIADAERGLIVTAYHLIERAESITVTQFDGREARARVLASSPGDDLAILGIEMSGLAPMALNRADDLQVGDFVLTIGNPLDGQQATTFGIVSGLHRAGPGTDSSDLIATDALIAQGNSGGALLNLRGELVGINIIRLGSGFAFAVPVAAVRKLLANVRLNG